VCLAPFLRWVNGPAVTTDQFVIQVFLASSAAIGAVALRFYNWRRAKGAPDELPNRCEPETESHADRSY
jgi:hypothetical protein